MLHSSQLDRAARLLQAGKIHEAKAIYERIVADDQRCVQAWHYLGICSLRLGDLPRASELVTCASELEPENSEILANLGEIKRIAGHVDDAIALIRRSLELRPRQPQALNNLGNALVAKGDFSAAIECYRRALTHSPDSAQFHYNLGIAFHRSGKADEAIASFKQAGALAPTFAEAPTALGLIYRAQRDAVEAVRWLEQAVRAAPRSAATHGNLGNLLREQGENQRAAASLGHAVMLKPDWPEAHNNLGNALKNLGQTEAAGASFREALRLNPDFSEALNNLGSLLRELGRTTEALPLLRRAVELNQRIPEAHNNLGAALQDSGDLEGAAAAFARALELNPLLAIGHSNLGSVLRLQGKIGEALNRLHRAIELDPALPEAHNNLGNTWRDDGRLDSARKAYEQAISLNPAVATFHSNLGTVLRDTGLTDQAVASFRKALELDPRSAEALNNLGCLRKDRGELDEAIGCFREALASRADYQAAHSNFLYTLLFHPDYGPTAIASAHRAWAEAYARLPRIDPGFARPDLGGRRLRIGYVSPDFRDHVVGRNVLPLFRRHDRTRFEIIAYSSVIRPDAITDEFRSRSDLWRECIGLSDADLAARIAGDKVDILVDLALHMNGSRLLAFARRPAPIQVTFAGYPGTTGLDTIDFRLTDPFLDPPGSADEHYTEISVRLPRTFWCYEPSGDEPDVGPLPAASRDYVTFGCLNNFCKINAAIIRTWAGVLCSVPDSRLALLTTEGSHRHRTLAEFAHHGIAAERIRFFSPASRRRYLEYYADIDVGLDTLPYNGHTTSLDSFWMGVPVVTLVGDTVAGRAGFSQLSNLGLAELAAENPAAFIATATALAKDLPRLRQLRANLRKRMAESPLGDTAAFVSAIETAYFDFWRTGPKR